MFYYIILLFNILKDLLLIKMNFPKPRKFVITELFYILIILTGFFLSNEKKSDHDFLFIDYEKNIVIIRIEIKL